VERSSELILRNESSLPEGSILLVNPPRDSLFRQLESNGRTVTLFTQHHGDFCSLSSSEANAAYGLLPDDCQHHSLVILHLPREKDLLAMMLQALSATMNEYAKLWLVGENRAGIKSARRFLDKNFGQVTKLDSARHCVLFECSAPSNTGFSLKTYETLWSVDFAAETLPVVSLPGVFAHGRLDQGSQRLLNALEKIDPRGKVLDFACGAGVIGCSLLARNPDIELTMTDVSSLAIESSQLTLNKNRMEADLIASDGLSQLEGTWDWIISNPPFHNGVHNDLEFAASFFSNAGTFLNENGRIVIVCNRHLPYSGWLQNHFKQVEHLDTDDQFMVIQARRPK
jgi:16S rRNA (guanine1207-N2)-methyltransferase